MKNSIKKLVCLICTVALCSSLMITSYAEENDFIVENGVLVEYNGYNSTVIIPDNVYEIADHVFENHSEITSIDFGSNVYYVGNYAFYNCDGLMEIGGHESISKVGAYAFYGTQWFDAIRDDVKMLNNIVIGGSPDLSGFEFPQNAVSVAPRAFYGNAGLESITCNENLIEIGEEAFAGCTSLKEFTYGSKLNYIGMNAFENTLWLSAVDEEFIIINGILIKYSGNDFIINLPFNVTQIGDGAFYNKSIESVTLPKNLFYIGKYAFAQSGLSDIDFLNCEIVYIGANAFDGCCNIEELTLTKSIKYIGRDAFSDCKETLFFVEPGTMGYEYVTKNGLNYHFTNVSGDINGDKVLSMEDVVALQRYIASLTEFTDKQKAIADVDSDGEISMQDVTYMQRKIAGLI
ncbi:MAG: leucine-rich repeat protein [Clostridia bacterium]|nr:leucine-rich repeat protein [Clostridia bacterium]